jgi:hypothetical protein
MINPDPFTSSFITFDAESQTVRVTPGLNDNGDYKIYLVSKSAEPEPNDLTQEVFIQVIPDPSAANDRCSKSDNVVSAAITKITSGGKVIIDFNTILQDVENATEIFSARNLQISTTTK